MNVALNEDPYPRPATQPTEFEAAATRDAVASTVTASVGFDPLAAARRYAALLDEHDRLEAVAKANAAAIAKLAPDVLEMFARGGVDKLTIGGRTLYPRTERYPGRAEGVAEEAAVAAVRAAGVPEFATERVNYQALRAWLAERERAGEPAPSEFDGVIVVREVAKVGQRRCE